MDRKQLVNDIQDAAQKAAIETLAPAVLKDEGVADKVASAGVLISRTLDKVDEAVEESGVAQVSTARADGRPHAMKELNQPAVPVVVADLCCHKRSDLSSCEKCIDICPMACIDFDDKSGAPVIEKEFCLGCELCCAVCATGALASSRMALPAQKMAIEKTARLFDVGYVTCSQTRSSNLSASIAQVPCLGCLPRELWFSAIFRYPNLQVYLPVGICEDCPCQDGEQMMVDAICDAEQWSGRRIGLEVEKENLDFMVLKQAAEQVDRRGLFTNIGKTARNIYRSNSITDAVEQFNMQKARMRSTLSALRAQDQERWEAKEKAAEEREAAKKAPKKVMFDDRRALTEPRRMLTDIFIDDSWIAPQCKVMSSSTDATVCVSCGKCVEACPMGARSLRGENGTAKVEALFCVGCGLCEDVCAKEACEVFETSADVLLEAARLGK